MLCTSDGDALHDSKGCLLWGDRRHQNESRKASEIRLGDSSMKVHGWLTFYVVSGSAAPKGNDA